MEIKAGYKQTEMGLIPDDWSINNLPDIVWYQEGPGLRKWQFRADGLKVINVTNLQDNGYLDLDKTDRHISWEECEKSYKHFMCDEGDLVIASSGNSYCKASTVRLIDLPLLMNTSVIRFKPKGHLSKTFMDVYLKSDYFKNQIDLMITGGAQPNFGPVHLNKIKIHSPNSTKEQKAIAEALGNADALIESLEKLIEKKQQIKQGAMQELLTGKKRLSGFSGEWQVKSLGQLFMFNGGYTASRDQLSFDGYCYLHYGDIHSSKNTFIDVDASFSEIPKLNIPLNKVSASSLLNDGDIVFVDASEDDEGASRHVVVINPNKTPFISGLHTIVAKRKTNEIHSLFLRYCFQTLEIKSQFKFYAVGTKVSGISKTNIAKINIKFPKEAEQLEIGKILSDMDLELTELEAKLQKARQIKQSMMQELLTGRIRLV